MSNIQDSEITFVIQGPLGKGNIKNTIDSVKLYFPKSKIIISTWQGENLDDEDSVDLVVYNEDPGNSMLSKVLKVANNVNRQIISTRNGLSHVKTKYAFKLRSDFQIIGKDFLRFFGNHTEYNSEFKVVKERIVASNFISINPEKMLKKSHSTPFHLGDLVFFGLTEDLYNLFDIDLVSEDEANYFDNDNYNPAQWLSRFVPEQHIFLKFMRKNQININCDHYYDLGDRQENIILTHQLFVNNFVLAPLYGLSLIHI